MYPKNIDLSVAANHGIHGKMIRFFSTTDMKFHCEKETPDHEVFMRKADAALLQHMTCKFYTQIEKLVNSNEIKVGTPFIALELLHECCKALGSKQIKTERFNCIEPHSEWIIFLATSYIRLALDELDPAYAVSSSTQLKRQFEQLAVIVFKAESRYDTIVFE